MSEVECRKAYVSVNVDVDEKVRFPRAAPIDQFAKDYLGLTVSFAKLSNDGSICGLTAYADTEYTVEKRCMMAGCKQDVASLLHEETEIRSMHEQLIQRRYQQAQQKQTPKKNRDSRDR